MGARFLLLVVLLAMPFGVHADPGIADPERDILVTFHNQGAKKGSAGISAPYKHRKRYSMAAAVRRHARAIAREYDLQAVDHWPIRSLDVYCFVYRVKDADNRQSVIERLQQDDRVESAQALQSFETSVSADAGYDDTFANLQHGLAALNVSSAHRYSTGSGIRVAIVDSDADTRHEDLAGRLRRTVTLSTATQARDADHGTAVVSIIGARTNNATGIVGIAPEARLELFVSCWHDALARKAVCDSFTLAKAIDVLLRKPPHVLNLSLTGPHDPLLERLLRKVLREGVVVIAAEPAELTQANEFPSILDGVIGVASSPTGAARSAPGEPADRRVYAPGSGILVALPDNRYDLRSGSSLAAAHVSGAVALLLAVAPDLGRDAIQRMLQRSQSGTAGAPSVDACELLRLADRAQDCGAAARASAP